MVDSRFEPADLALHRLLSPERMRPYLNVSAGSWESARRLYEWNVHLSSSVMGLTGMVEVFIRNALDAELTRLAESRGSQEWTCSIKLDHKGLADLEKARSRSHQSTTHGRVIAELTFGFWRYLVSHKYLTSLWIPALVKAFPHLDTDPAQARRQVETEIQQLHYLRNRAAHNEPLHRRDVAADVERAKRLIGWIVPDAQTWLTVQERVSDEVRRRPLSDG